jgi:hypothetical protein
MCTLRAFGLLLFALSITSSTNAATLDTIYQDSHTITCGTDGFTLNALSRGAQGKQNTSIILQGIANTMSDVEKIVNAKDTAEKKRGFLSAISTILSTIAMLIIPRITSREAIDQTISTPQLDERYIQEISSLITSVHALDETTKQSSCSTLDQFRNISNSEERKTLLAKILEDDSLHSVFIADLCLATYQTLLRVVPDFVPQLNQAMQDFLLKLANEQSPKTNQPLSKKITLRAKNAILEGVGMKRKPATLTAATI